MYRLAHAVVCTAAADVCYGHVDLRVRGIGLAVEERHGRENHTRLAVAALGHALGDPGALDGVTLVLREPLDRDNRLSGHGAHRNHAAAYGLAVEQYRAGPAASQAATELRPGELERIAQSPQQRSILFHVDAVLLSIDIEDKHTHVLTAL